MIEVTNDIFTAWLEEYHKESYETLAVKAKEYSKNGNRFHNFDLAVQLLKPLGVIDSPAKVAFCFKTKQLISIIDMLVNPETVTEGMLKEKFGDDVNYDFLIRGLLQRDITEPKLTAEEYAELAF